MKKNLIQRGFFGFPIGIAINYIITLIISILIGDGLFYPVNPDLINTMGNELNAVLLQTLLCGIMGTGFAMASIIWELDSWSIAKQSVIYFSVACLVTFPISYVAKWMPHSVIGTTVYVGIFIFILVFVWLIQYCIYKRNIRRINEKLNRGNDEDGSF